jgi:hypothetical protein
MKYLCGAYTSAPSLHRGDRDCETQFYERLKTCKRIGGLEIPFWGDACHPFGNKFFRSCLSKNWKNSLTCVPCSVAAQRRDPKIGLASTDENSRKVALEMHKRAHETFLEFNDYFGTNIFRSIQVTSAPPQKVNHASVSAFAKSLEQIIGWEWAGARVMIEHCDRFRPDEQFEKGYLSLEEEISAAKRLDSGGIGFVINTGRSAIEGRNIGRIGEHLESVCQIGFPVGLIFSGTSRFENSFGPWKDLHMPFGCFNTSKFPYEQSILTKGAVDKICADLSPFLEFVEFYGFKLMPISQNYITIDERIGVNEDAINILDGYFA